MVHSTSPAPAPPTPPARPKEPGTWVSWNGNVSHPYTRCHVVRSEAELAGWVAEAKEVRVFGHRYSSADISAGSQTLLDMTQYDGIVGWDLGRREVTVQAGITLGGLIGAIEAKGWAIPCLPDIDAVTLGGALATGTHGSGREGKMLSGYMVACRLVLADGQVEVIGAEDPRMPAVRVSLGVLGVFSEVTLRCEPLYTLRLLERPMADRVWLRQLEQLHGAHEFLRILWLPHTGFGYVITGDRCDPEEAMQMRLGPPWLGQRRRVSKLLYRHSVRFPWLTAWANKLLFLAFFTATKEHKGTLYEATVTKRRSSTMELAEWAVPRQRFPALFAELKATLEDPRNAAYAHLPMDIRFLQQEDSWLGYSYGGDCVTVGCVCRDSARADRYQAFEVLEEVFLRHGGRPHWAKRFGARAPVLAALYPRWQEFVRLREAMDPQGKAAQRAFAPGVWRVKRSRLPRPCGVLFDFDGVIVHSKLTHRQAWDWAHRHTFGKPVSPSAASWPAGLASTEIAALLATAAGAPHLAEQLYQVKLARLMALDTLPQMLPGVDALFERLKTLGIPFGVVSNGPGTFLRHCLAGLGLGTPVALGVQEVRAPKPDPAPYLELAHRLGLGPEGHERVWVLEDSVVGMRAAVGAGMCGIGVGGKREEGALLAHGARTVVRTPGALLAWVQNS